MPARAEPMQIRFVDLLKWVVPIALSVGLAGAYPTWRAGGPAAMSAQAAAGGIVLSAVLLSGGLVAFAGLAGPGQVTMAFLVSGMLRTLVSVGLGLLLVWKTDIPAVPLLVWLAVFYLAMFLAEGAWVVRALRRYSAEPSLREVMRPRPMTPMDIE